MSNLTAEMTRLRGEVDEWRSSREALMKSLADGARELARSVGEMQDHFAGARASMAKKGKKERMAFVTELRKGVNRLKRETAVDLAGARRVWNGKTASTK
ncbi:MAG: hypothetical protein WC889_16060 [Myxococcota bacterium]|jgi:hypothetical protein